MSEQERESSPDATGIPEPELRGRRAFLVSLGKWSKAVIGGVVLGGLLTPERDARAWGWATVVVAMAAGSISVAVGGEDRMAAGITARGTTGPGTTVPAGAAVGSTGERAASA